MRAFEEKEKMRVRNALEEHDTKSARRMREMREKNAIAIKELEEIHVCCGVMEFINSREFPFA